MSTDVQQFTGLLVEPLAPAQSGDWPLWRKKLWIVLACGAFLMYGCALPTVFMMAGRNLSDFYQEWTSALNVFNGQPVYRPLADHLGMRFKDNDELLIKYNAHPPTSVLLALPFGLLSYETACLVWNLLSIGCLIASGWLVFKTLGLKFHAWCILPVATLLMGNPLLQHLAQGQLTLLLLILITGSWLADRRDRPILAGFLLGLAAVIKIFPAFLFVVFLVQRNWRALASGALTVLYVTLMTIWLLGPDTYYDYVNVVMPEVFHFQGARRNASFVGMWSRMFNGRPETIMIFYSPWVAKLGTWLCDAAVVGAIMFFGDNCRSRPQRDLLWGMALAGMLLVSPITWDHYFLALLLPVTLLWNNMPQSRACRWVFGISLAALWMNSIVPWLVLMGPNPNEAYTTPLETLAFYGWHCYALVALLVLCIITSRKIGPRLPAAA